MSLPTQTIADYHSRALVNVIGPSFTQTALLHCRAVFDPAERYLQRHVLIVVHAGKRSVV
jgi:hypothetical protein